VQVRLVVPSGASPHSYEPTAKQTLNASKADLWFQIGEPFEKKAMDALSSYGSTLKAVDLRLGIDMIVEKAAGHAHCCHHGCEDPHIWLSPKLVKKQAVTIAKALSELYPENAKVYQKNLLQLQKDLDELDNQISFILTKMKNRRILVSHPAFAYYSRDYKLEQYSIEFEGKEPTPKHLTKILAVAQQKKTPFIFVQAQHLSKGAKLVAQQIGAQIIEIDPLAENYFENMRQMTCKFAMQ